MVTKLLLRAILGLLVVSTVFAQDKKDAKKLDLFDMMSQEKTGVSLSQPSGIALESTVDPEEYFVGPSDVIGVNIWMSPPQSYGLTVTPEGTLIIPTVGEVLVSNLTLAKAKEKILSESRKKYLNVAITATLVKPRPIIVNVTGQVANAGLYTLNAVDRVDRAIEEANKPVRGQEQGDILSTIQMSSARHIVVRHHDGSQSEADIRKYYATHNGKLNPYLREGDLVVVPRIDPLKNVIALYGQVNTTGRFEFVEGDSLLVAIRMANGLTTRALAEEAVFSRLSPDGTTLTNRTVNLANIMSGKEADIPLEPGDRIVVSAKPELREDFNVDIRGEVRYAGTYPITRDRTHLSQVIAQAGGFTEFASLENSEVIRRSLLPENKVDIEKEETMSLRGSKSSPDTLGYSLETTLRIRHETVVVDFKKLFADHDSTKDIILQREDQIIIPARQKTIYVFGQVVSPGHIPLTEGKDMRYYIDKAGGYTDRASKGDVRIIKATTKQWLKPGDTSLEQGDNIWVPTDETHPFSYYMTTASQAASVISVVLGIAILVVQVSK
jgi:protein involved in polysaccharide export with SLBB domain